MPPEELLFFLVFSVCFLSVSELHSIEINLPCPDKTATICRTFFILIFYVEFCGDFQNGMVSGPFCDWAGLMQLK